MTKKNIIIIVSIGVVIIGAVTALLLVNEKVLTGNNQNQNNNANQQNANTNNAQLPSSVDVEGPAKPALNSAEQTIFFSARNFSERFSSFSSDSAGQNINELKSLTTSDLFKKLQTEITKKSAGGFYSVSSKALKVDILNSNDSEAGSAEASSELGRTLAEANIIVSLQRNEVKDNKAPFVFNQNLELKLIKAGDKWLVSEANWQ